MRNVLIALLLVACGKDNKATDAPPVPKDSSIDSPVDAPAVAACANPVSGTTVRLRRVGSIGGGGAMLVTAPPGDTRLFVVDKGGAIRIFDSEEALLPAAFIEFNNITTTGEQGLLGLAFHPQYASNGLFFVFFTRAESDVKNPVRDVVARCKRSAADPNKAEATCVEVLAIADPFTNHNGGMIEFGKDGFLYIGTGDGGDGGDRNDTGQALTTNIDNTNPSKTVDNTNALLGKILRIDVDNKAAGKEYGIPTDNPFAAGGGEPEIFALGLRNPWRWSFDSLTGDMWIADVGQGGLGDVPIEEVDVVKAADIKGKNFGWSKYQGNVNNCFKPPCTPAGMTFPQFEHDHGNGWNAIVGGQVYRGTCFPDIAGTYFFADNGASDIFKATLNADGSVTATELQPASGEAAFPGSPASIHADARGELYLTTTSGAVFHVEAGPP
ncbi:MAG: PQQ-dependent sugar dehydrogenase [Kofleriaceae bacterium]